MNCFSIELPNGFNKTWLLFHVRTLLWIQMKTKFEFEAVISWSKVDFEMKINKGDNTHVKSFFKMQYERCSSNKNIKINNDKTTSTTTKTTNKQHVKHDNLFIFSHSFNLHVFNILCVYASASVCASVLIPVRSAHTLVRSCIKIAFRSTHKNKKNEKIRTFKC